MYRQEFLIELRFIMIFLIKIYGNMMVCIFLVFCLISILAKHLKLTILLMELFFNASS